MNNIKQLKTDFDNLIIEKNYCLSDPEVVSKAIELENILNNTLKKSQTLYFQIFFFDTVFKNNFTVQIFAFFNIGNRNCLDFNKFTVLVIQCTYQ